VLLVAFANLIPDNSLAPFCYQESLKRYAVNKWFVRDLHKFMYLRGIDDSLDSVKKLASRLKKMMRAYGPEKTIFIGNSSGGYAAILYGLLTRPDDVLAFAPRTYLDRKNRERFDDTRNPHIVDVVAKESSKYRAHKYLDLQKLYDKKRPRRTRFHLYWDRNHRIDDINATRMSFPNVFLHPQDEGGHLIAKHLRDRELFHPIIKNVLEYR
jgi:pimeloyl-ACP methyl ester carboxylesterase